MKPRNPHWKNSGQALLEFALILPILVLLLLGIYDFSSAIRANNAISNISREGASLASRSSIPPQDIMNTLAANAQPLKMQDSGMIYITVVESIDGQLRIRSQDGWNGSGIKGTTPSKIGSPGENDPNPLAFNLATLNLTEGQTATVVEVFYNYRSAFPINADLLGRQFYSRTVF